jgi:uncharacterized protein (TIGR03435 family)
MPTLVARTVLVVFAAGATLAAQGAAPAFEVASVKPSNTDAAPPRMPPPVGGRFAASNITLRQLIRNVYDLMDSRIEGGPDWQTSRRFDIQAKAADPVAGLDAMRPMIKALLADRFQLKVHTETRDMSIYALVLARDDGRLGANITRSTADCSKADGELAEIWAKAGPGAVAELLKAGKGLPCAIMPVSPARVAGAATMRANGASMAALAQFLTPPAGRLVQDRTGLGGLYDWELTYDPRPPGNRSLSPLSPPPGSNTPLSTPPPFDSPSVMIAIQEQLGLKLEPTRGPVEILVIDSAEPPTPD